ncbi:MAG: signal peptidase I [Lachnospiraceae bacterium]|nr:signal peptidase I [Lachnospiraceae bacterium]
MTREIENRSLSEKPKKASPFWIRFLRILILIIAIVGVSITLSQKVFFVYRISGNAMEPAYRKGDIVLTAARKEYKAGQIVVVSDGGKLLIRRIAALSGDKVDITKDGVIVVNGTALDERSYISQPSYGKTNISLPMTVPEESVFLLGDNRKKAIDSRVESFGCLKTGDIKGRVLFRIWPLWR